MSHQRGQFLVKSMEENNKIKEIMSKYRPIAPMPPMPPAPTPNDSPTKPCGAFTTLHPQSRPCRVRKRGRPSLGSFQVGKRSKPIVCPSTSTDAVATTTRTISFVPYTTLVPVSTHGIPTVPVTGTTTRTNSFVPYKTQVQGSTHGLPTVPVTGTATRPNSFVPYKTDQVPVSTLDLPAVPVSSTTTREKSFVPYKPQVPVSTHDLPTVPVSCTTTKERSFIPYKTEASGSTHRLHIVPVPGTNKVPVKPVETSKDPLTLSLVPYSGSYPTAPTETERDIPVEKDLIKKLTEVLKAKAPEDINPKVTIPHPIRPVDSTVFVGCIVPIIGSLMSGPTCKTPGEVEQDMETETLPTVVSDSQNMVRLTNSAYKALIGQPKCPWLETIVRNPCKRINGAVKFKMEESMMPEEPTNFTCRVKIEWALNGITNYVCAPCDVRMLYCASRDYVLMWKIRTNEGFFSSGKGWIQDGAVW